MNGISPILSPRHQERKKKKQQRSIQRVFEHKKVFPHP